MALRVQDQSNSSTAAPSKRIDVGTTRFLKKLFPKEIRHVLRQTEAFLFDHNRFRHLQAEKGPRYEFFRRAFVALRENGITGDYAEFGCHGGLTFSLANRYSKRVGLDCKLWAFDSFQGLPRSTDPRDEHPLWQEGFFHSTIEEFLDNVTMFGVKRERIRLVPGFYYDSLAPGARPDSELPSDIAMAYIDCDLYTSTRDVLNFLKPRLKHGMILAFDDYFAQAPHAVSGERLAFLELQKHTPQFNYVPYIQYGTMGQSYIVEDKSLLGDFA